MKGPPPPPGWFMAGEGDWVMCGAMNYYEELLQILDLLVRVDFALSKSPGGKLP